MQFPGSAVWAATLFEDGDVCNVAGTWTDRVASGHLRPDEETLSRAFETYYGCGREEPCENLRCPSCWDDGHASALEVNQIACSTYIRVPLVASYGQGCLKGGDAKTADRPGPRDDWALGGGGGDNVEVYNGPPPPPDVGTVATDQLTLVKILYFLHEGNPRSLSGEPPPLTWWVLGYEYVGVGEGNERVPDSITGHPTLLLRGRGRPLVFPVDAIRRQVHIYHQCPRRGDVDPGQAFVCEQTQGEGRTTRAWHHRFRLAHPGSHNGYDRYLLNEVHHSVNQDTFV